MWRKQRNPSESTKNDKNKKSWFSIEGRIPKDITILVFKTVIEILRQAGQWWHRPLISALGRQRQVNLCEFEASLVYRASSRIGFKATQRNPMLEKKINKTTATNSFTPSSLMY